MPTIAETKARLESGDVTATELITSTLDAIEAAEGGDRPLNAFLSLRRELATAEAEALDWEREEGIELGPLAGVPIAVKDNIAVADGPTTAGSRILEGFVPPFDASAIARLKHAGAIVVGKTNLDEFAMGSSTENSAFGVTRNPHDLTRVPGGSSGGSAAAVAAGYVPGALGSDTGGSIRQPAALCGVVGLKPTYGRVSRYGLVAFASSLDQIGPLAGTVQDAAHLLSAIAGHDPQDSTSARRPVPDYACDLQRPLRGLRIGLPREYFPSGLDPDVQRACDQALDRLRRAGAQVKEVSLPHTDAGIAAYYVVATAEASSNLARYDGVRYGLRASEAEDVLQLYLRTRHEGFGPEVRRRIMLGTYVLSAGYYEAYYKKGVEVQALIARDFEAAFQECHCLLTPPTPTPAFRIGEKVDDPLAMYLADVYTVAVNLAGIPAISVPAGEVNGLPLGVQLIGPRWSEERLLNVAWHVENDASEAGFRPTAKAADEPEAEPEPELVGVVERSGRGPGRRRGGAAGERSGRGAAATDRAGAGGEARSSGDRAPADDANAFDERASSPGRRPGGSGGRTRGGRGGRSGRDVASADPGGGAGPAGPGDPARPGNGERGGDTERGGAPPRRGGRRRGGRGPRRRGGGR